MIQERETLHRCPRCDGMILEKIEILTRKEHQKNWQDLTGSKRILKLFNNTEESIGFVCSKCNVPFENEEALAPRPEDAKYYCHVCKTNTVVETFGQVFDPSYGPPIIGPGSMDQYQTVSQGFHCTGCGLEYRFGTPPKDDQ